MAKRKLLNRRDYRLVNSIMSGGKYWIARICAQNRFVLGHMWAAAALSVATSIAVMHAMRTLHPPGGATALIAVIGGDQIHAPGYLYVVLPAGLGALIMLIVALAVNNIPRSRRYPEFWF